MRRRFFVEQFSGDTATLQGPPAHHLARVLRAEPGQLYELSDGRSVFLARIESVGRDSVDFALLDPIAARAARLDATLLLAVVKFDHFEWALEKATELGAGTIVPLAAARSEKALLAAAPKRAARWQKILFESAQQARCLRPPLLRDLARPRDAFSAERSGMKIVLSEEAGAPPLKVIFDSAAPAEEGAAVRIALAVGPEGGWTDEEFAAARGAGFDSASFGCNILRTETAVVAALSAAHLYFD